MALNATDTYHRLHHQAGRDNLTVSPILGRQSHWLKPEPLKVYTGPRLLGRCPCGVAILDSSRVRRVDWDPWVQ